MTWIFVPVAVLLCVILLTLVSHLLINGRLKITLLNLGLLLIPTFDKWNNGPDLMFSLCSGRDCFFPQYFFMAPHKAVLSSDKRWPETRNFKCNKFRNEVKTTPPQHNQAAQHLFGGET